MKSEAIIELVQNGDAVLHCGGCSALFWEPDGNGVLVLTSPWGNAPHWWDDERPGCPSCGGVLEVIKIGDAAVPGEYDQRHGIRRATAAQEDKG